MANRYVLGEDGLKRLQTVRLDDENLYTPELNTFTANSDHSFNLADVESREEGGRRGKCPRLTLCLFKSTAKFAIICR